jgi:hypothetical protein
MKFEYSNRVLLEIPYKIINLNLSKIKFKLERPITNNEKEILWATEDINKLKVIINDKNDYIYKFHLVKFDDIYELSTNKIMINQFSKNLNCCWFLNNL